MRSLCVRAGHRAVGAAVLGLGGCWSISLAQSTQPQFYMWERPPGFTGTGGTFNHATAWQFDPRFQPIVRYVVGNSTSGAADAAACMNLIEHWLDPAHQALAPDRLVVTLQNYATRNYHSMSAFIQTDDDLDFLAWDHPVYDAPNNPALARFQPYMANGRVDARAWMESFLDAFDPHDPNTNARIVPVMFAFDMEDGLLPDFGSVNLTRLIAAAGQDATSQNRWSQHVMPWSGLSLAQEWSNAQALYGWTATNLYTALDLARTSTHDSNKEYVLWWSGICAKALASAMDYGAYQPIRAMSDSPTDRWYGHHVRVGNYGYNNMDMQPDTFGWRLIRHPEYQNSPLQEEKYLFTNQWFRGEMDRNRQHGAMPRWVYSSGTVNNEHPLVGHWLLGGGQHTGDVDSPYLYDFETNSTFSQEDWYHNQANWYRPWGNDVPLMSVSTNEMVLPSPAETLWEASRRNHRHILESIINTPGGHPDNVVPWILMTDTPGRLSPVTPLATRDQLALLRSKDIKEILVWGNGGPQTLHPDSTPGNPVYIPERDGVGNPESWLAFKRAYEHVYDPQLVYYYTWTGDELNAPYEDPSKLHFTLRVDGEDYTVDQRSEQWIGDPEFGQTELLVKFEGFARESCDPCCPVDPFEDPVPGCPDANEPIDPTCWTGLTLVLEGSVRPWDWSDDLLTTYFLNSTRVHVLMWDWCDEEWYDMDLSSELMVGVGFGIGAPDGSFRRQFRIAPESGHGAMRFINAEGAVLLRLLTVAPYGDYGYKSKWDLVQLYRYDREAISGIQESTSGGNLVTALGGDFDLDGTTSVEDAAQFISAWVNGSPRGDFNGDLTLDEQDIEQYMATFEESAP